MAGQETIQAVTKDVMAQINAQGGTSRPSGSSTPPSQTANYVIGGVIGVLGIGISSGGMLLLLKQGISAWLTAIPLGLGIIVVIIGASVADDRVYQIVNKLVLAGKGMLPGKSGT